MHQTEHVSTLIFETVRRFRKMGRFRKEGRRNPSPYFTPTLQSVTPDFARAIIETWLAIYFN